MKQVLRLTVVALVLAALVGLFNAWRAFVHRFSSDPNGSWVYPVPLVGMILGGATVFFLVHYLRAGREIRSVARALEGAPLKDGEPCAVVGELHARGDALLTAPFSRVPCLVYFYDVGRMTRVMARSRRNGSTVRRISGFVGRAMVPCEVRTEQGPIALLDAPPFPVLCREVPPVPGHLPRARAFLESCSFRDADEPGPIEANEAEASRLVRETGGCRYDLRFSNPRAEELERPFDLSKWELRERAIAPGSRVLAMGVWSEARKGLGSGTGAFAGSLELRAGDPAGFVEKARESSGYLRNMLGGVVAAQVVLAFLVMLS